MASLPTVAKQKKQETSANTANKPQASYLTISAPGLRKAKHFGSAPSVMAEPGPNQNDSDLVFKFSKQVNI